MEGLSFGERIAEQETDGLARYFVETDDWRKLVAGEKDLIYGTKGSGKSALYSLMVQKSDEFFDRGILIVPAENPRGTPAFAAVVGDPPGDEEEFRNVWKLYFLSLAARVLQEWGVQTPQARDVYAALEEMDLLKKGTLKSLLTAVRKQARRLSKAESYEAGLAIDPKSGMPLGITGRITSAATEPESIAGVELDDLLNAADLALGDLDFKVWILVDRLDVAFAGHDAIENRALRALFRGYLDMQSFSNLALKIFLRTDIWHRVTSDGFREASHVSRGLTIKWEPQSLMNLVLRRALTNEVLTEYYSVDAEVVCSSVSDQEDLFGRMFPPQVDLGRNRSTFDWMLNRTQDGTGQTAPRELIHLLATLREEQLKRIEVGHTPPEGEQLFDRTTFKAALAEVSEIRLTQTLYAEYPRLKPYIERLEGEKTQQSLRTLAGMWSVGISEARRLATELVDVGFFEQRGSKDEPTYWVPFLYRDALRMSQGEAKEFLPYGRQMVDAVIKALSSAIPRAQKFAIATKGAGEGFEEGYVSFIDARSGIPMVIWLAALEPTSRIALKRRIPVLCAGLKQDLTEDLDHDAFAIRLNATNFRWYTHRDGRAGYRIVVEMPNFTGDSVEPAIRQMNDKLNSSLRLANFIGRR